MANNRRTAEEALDQAIEIERFISRGVDDDKTQPSPNTAHSDLTDQSQHSTKKSVIERKPRKRQESKRSNSEGAAPRKTTSDLRNELPRIYSKATIQKTVRFRPQLIQSLDEWSKARESKGEPQMSFQQIQNEALKLWLETNLDR